MGEKKTSAKKKKIKMIGEGGTTVGGAGKKIDLKGEPK